MHKIVIRDIISHAVVNNSLGLYCFYLCIVTMEIKLPQYVFQ